VASKVITTIKSWLPTEDEKFQILAWDADGGNACKFANSAKTMLDNVGLENSVYCNFNEKEQFYIHAHSVKMFPINMIPDMECCQEQCQKFVKKNLSGSDDWIRPNFRLMVNLKFRGFQNAGAKGLFSDRLNNNIAIQYPIPSRMHVNECVVFEWDILNNAVKNYFFNASTKQFVNFKRPSWRSIDME
jgi:hypothetical protein